MNPCPKRANGCHTVPKKRPQGKQMRHKSDQTMTLGRAVSPCGCRKAAREAKKASVGTHKRTKGAPEMRLATKRKRTWVQKVPKKGSKSELLKKSKIKLSLQRELKPARPRTPQMETQNRVAHRKHRNEAIGALGSTVRSQTGTKRDPVPPWRSGGSTKAPAPG